MTRWGGKAVYLCCGATDMRKQINGLCAIVESRFKLDSFSGELFVFCNWVESCGALPKTPASKAVHYALSQKKYLKRYLEDGRLEISNNRAERNIKPFVIGRKTFLFCNTQRGAKSSAVIYSIIETAKENGIDPFEYLVRIFQNAPTGVPVHKLLPQRL